jgi:hypothetical protein
MAPLEIPIRQQTILNTGDTWASYEELLLLLFLITFMQDIYTYIPESMSLGNTV